MIVKHVSMRSLGKSDFAGLVRYITSDQAKEHRIGDVRLTNCAAHSVRDAMTEVLATQQENTRAKGDKTYHLLVSFRAGEEPDAAILAAIEDRLCVGLGFGEHQRVSTVHHDTDNLHIHIAINKIHPTRKTIHEPYYPHRALAELCSVLEGDYGLQPDNHELRRRGAEARAADMERHSGIESLVGWIKRECAADIRGAQSWSDLHEIMQANGLDIRAKGSGLVIEARDGTQIKASTLGRELSKAKLETRFGPFVASPEQRADTQPERQYEKKPLLLRVNTVELYAQYQSAQRHASISRAAALTEMRRHKDKQVESARVIGQLRRASIKLLGGGRLTKKILYAQASRSVKSDLDAIYADHRFACKHISEQHRRQTWADWLKQEALQGNVEALVALRAREAAGLKGDTIKGRGQARPSDAQVIDNITKKGTIIYRAGSSAVRDDGERLQVSRGANQEAVKEVLLMAVKRYGNQITVTGSNEFKVRVIRAAVSMRLPITFTDPSMERLHQLNGRVAAMRVNSVRPPIKRVGQEPPPKSRGRLRTLSQLETLTTSIGGHASSPAQPKRSAMSDLAQRRADNEVAQFRSAANRRKIRAYGYGDSGAAWQRLPDEVRGRIDQFNALPPERQEIELARLRREAAGRPRDDSPPVQPAQDRKGRSR